MCTTISVVSFSSASKHLCAASLEFPKISLVSNMMLFGVSDIVPSGSSDLRSSVIEFQIKLRTVAVILPCVSSFRSCVSMLS